MKRFLKYLAIPLFAFALVFVTGDRNANAGGFSLRIGGFGNPYYSRGFSIGNNYYPRTYRSYRYGGAYRHSYRPHYDYHPPSVYRHGNHYDYVPGHYDFHQGGHHGHHGHH
ncbi:hypothetical protein FYK55_10025 [Roseiconus nitratireducens]|uniref:Uncharacterized protein n=1 Tax=Roseiconus nitratireducens TaxID=2605748 RepID=A0A5M6DAQ8_9BACT|nr:hypothetical protein [Roseiconus nitratireducens]KAA5544637.1 hypothetical protein FYK55_10025 [Roseiconus nitratireducens]